VTPQRWVLLALVAGLGIGSALAANPSAAFAQIVPWVEPVGTIWVSALRMVVVPLVMSMLVTGVATMSDARALRRIGSTSFAVWISLLLVSGALGLTLVPFLFQWLTIDPLAIAALRDGAAELANETTTGLSKLPSMRQWFVDLVPTNPVRAAADGAMLPLVVFSLAFGLAVTRLSTDQRDALLRVFGGVAAAMLEIVRWVLLAAPVGVFALSLTVASKVGAIAAGALGYYLAVTAISMGVLSLLLFALAAMLGRVAPSLLARALLPAQVVGFTSRSSLATMPAQAEAAANVLRLPQAVVAFVLPLAVASFKPHGPLNWSSLAIVSAMLYGVPIGVPELLTVVGSAILLSFAVPGIPSAGMLLIAPVFVNIGVPVEAIGLLIAVDALPDMFKTVANVTGQFCSAVIVARVSGETNVT
jgi:Na+/H+-dicarboxylate symporter